MAAKPSTVPLSEATTNWSGESAARKGVDEMGPHQVARYRGVRVVVRVQFAEKVDERLVLGGCDEVDLNGVPLCRVIPD